MFFDLCGTLVEPLRTLEEMWSEVSRRVSLEVEINVLVQAHEDADRRAMIC